MEQCLHQYFIVNDDLHRCCDFHDGLLVASKAVYEVVRLIDNKLLFLKDHLVRLFASMQLTGIEPIITNKYICDTLQHLIRSNKVHFGNIKIFVGMRSDQSNPYLVAWFVPHSYPGDEMYRRGVKVSLFEYKRRYPNAKIVRKTFKEQVDARMAQTGSYELLLHDETKITEGSRSNVFFIINGTLRTAPDRIVLMGITRQKIMEIISHEQLPLETTALKLEELAHVEAAFVCGTSPKVLAISNIEDKYFPHPDHQLTRIITSRYEQMIHEYLDGFSWEGHLDCRTKAI